MYTQCPHCDTLFRISISQLKTAHGKVRCGHCNSIFNALLNLSEQIREIPTINDRAEHPTGDDSTETVSPKPATVPLSEQDTSIPAPAVSATPAHFTVIDDADDDHTIIGRIEPALAAPSLTDAIPPGADEPGFTPRAHATLRELTITDPLTTSPAKVAPIFAPERRSMPRLTEAELMDYEALDKFPPDPPKKPVWLAMLAWTFGVLALLALFIAQYAYFMREDLAGYTALRPGMEKFCTVVATFAKCDLPLRRDLTQIVKVDSSVTPHPETEDALRINTTLVNKADFPQPYPYLQVTLSDVSGTVIAKRRFHPNEYLRPDTDIRSGMSPHASIPIVLEVATPSTDFKLTSWSIDLF